MTVPIDSRQVTAARRAVLESGRQGIHNVAVGTLRKKYIVSPTFQAISNPARLWKDYGIASSNHSISGLSLIGLCEITPDSGLRKKI
ncbi:hypothetical protein [Halobellus litoreus]|uniref:Uncharacterized protein n=1 Tax=Halobellus litoreus TaxID=755310 RepID=A0ABD6E3X9_9EURY|nr:hypothetical protein [Halobellus litoreus]